MNPTLSTSVNRLFNISAHEWPRLKLSWFLTFFSKTSLLLGWTILVASFVSRLGITNLPYLFIIHAALIILGTILFAELVHNLSKNALLITTASIIAVLLLLATLFVNNNDIFYFTFLLLATSFLLSQLAILISIFNEELYSPLESQRTFPLIDSAETIGGITAGIIINRFAHLIPTYGLIYIWIILVLAIIPLIVFCSPNSLKLPSLKLLGCHSQPFRIRNLKENINIIKKIPFLKGLLIIVLMQWTFVNIFEFQYTKSIHQEVLNQKNSAEFKPPYSLVTKSNETELTYDLGSLHILFNSLALIVQLFLASRLINQLGTVNSMMTNPLVMLIASLVLLFKYNFFTAVIAKSSFEISNVLFKTPYHSSFYALSSAFRKQAKEFLEGIAKPLGAIIGTISLILFQAIYLPENLSLAINITLIALSIILLIQLYFLQNKFTALSTAQLVQECDRHSQMNALEILSQKGHSSAVPTLTAILLNNATDEELKIKTLETLGIIQENSALPEILHCLQDRSSEVRGSALSCLGKFQNLDRYTNENAFTLYRIVTTLKALFNQENDEKNRCLIIEILAQFNNTDTVDFIIKKLQNSQNLAIKGSCLLACSTFRDPNCAYYILPYLHSPHLYLRAKAISALWNFPKFHQRMEQEFMKLIKNQALEEIPLIASELIGNLGLKNEKKWLKQWLNNNNEAIQIPAALALIKLGETSVYSILAKKLLECREQHIHEITASIQNLSLHERREFEAVLLNEASSYINRLVKKEHFNSLNELPRDILKKLQRTYRLAKSYREYYEITHLIQNRQCA